MQVQDAVHGYITLNELEEEILDTPEMQRLRRVRQLGFSNLVYPSATHSRFEHSLGAMHLADMFAEALQVGTGRAQELRLAAMLHDLGHGPFSHSTDHIFHRHGMSHEQFSKQKIRDSRISTILHDHGIHPKRIIQLIEGDGRLGGIIAGHIDVDRMDYLMRDAHYTGVAYGTIDASTIIRSARIHDGNLVFDGKYINALESLLTARYLMIPTVYTHRTSQVASSMFREAFRMLHDDDVIDVAELPYMDDPELINRLRTNDRSAWLMDRIDNRELYKIAARSQTSHDIDERQMAKELRDETGLDRGEVIVDVIRRDESTAYDVPVLMNDQVRTLDAVSTLPTALQDSLQDGNELRVYTPREHVDTVSVATEHL